MPPLITTFDSGWNCRHPTSEQNRSNNRAEYFSFQTIPLKDYSADREKKKNPAFFTLAPPGPSCPLRLAGVDLKLLNSKITCAVSCLSCLKIAFTCSQKP